MLVVPLAFCASPMPGRTEVEEVGVLVAMMAPEPEPEF